MFVVGSLATIDAGGGAGLGCRYGGRGDGVVADDEGVAMALCCDVQRTLVAVTGGEARGCVGCVGRRGERVGQR